MYKGVGAGRQRRNKAKEEWPGTCEEEQKETSSESSDSEGEQEVNRVVQDQVWPGTSARARKRNIRHIAVEGDSKSGNKSKSSDENENSDTEGEQEDNQIIWDHVRPGTREKARKRSIRNTVVEGSMYEAKGAGRSRKYKGKGAGCDKEEKSTAKPKKMVKEDTAGMNKNEGAGRGEYLEDTDIGEGHRDSEGRGRQVPGRDKQDDMYKAGGVGEDDIYEGEGVGLDDMMEGVEAGQDDMIEGMGAGLDDTYEGEGAGMDDMVKGMGGGSRNKARAVPGPS